MLAQINNLDVQIEAIRNFNRFYAERMGIFSQQGIDSSFSLTEIRVIYEIFVSKSTTAKDLCQELDLDPGYLSRILNKLEEQDILIKRMSQSDGRQRKLALTVKGRKAYAIAAEKSNRHVQGLLEALTLDEQSRLIEAMQTIEMLLQNATNTERRFLLRAHKPSDMPLIAQRHVMQFAKDYGWNEEFEAVVTEATSDFIRNFDATGERCWVADMEGEVVGSVFVVRVSDEVAELRLLFVDPKVRALGIGSKMLKEATRFARYAGYKKMVMWTESIFDHAAKLFESEGFKLTEETPHKRFGRDMVGQYWEMDLYPF